MTKKQYKIFLAELADDLNDISKSYCSLDELLEVSGDDIPVTPDLLSSLVRTITIRLNSSIDKIKCID